MDIKKMVVNHFRGNTDKYFSYHNKYFDTKSKLLRCWYKYKIIKYENKWGGYIGCQKKDGKVFKEHPICPHGILGIFISSEAKIGVNCIIMQNVTIGMGKNGAPVIGDGVFIGANACVIGGIKVGNNVRIGAGAVVIEDVPDNTTVVSQKPRYIIKSNEYVYKHKI